MAYQHNGPTPNNGKFYNVEQAVGLSGVNAPGDVKLVQYMLRSIYSNEAANLAIDGRIGPLTISWIQRFQRDSRGLGFNVLPDSTIDRAFAELSTVSKTVYSILLMNRVLRQKNPAAYDKVPAMVPLSSSPRPNPYNPNKKTIMNSTRTKTADGWLIANVYSDGSSDVFIVKGNLPPGGSHGLVLSSTVDYDEDHVAVSISNIYEDLYVETYSIN